MEQPVVPKGIEIQGIAPHDDFLPVLKVQLCPVGGRGHPAPEFIALAPEKGVRLEDNGLAGPGLLCFHDIAAIVGVKADLPRSRQFQTATRHRKKQDRSQDGRRAIRFHHQYILTARILKRAPLSPLPEYPVPKVITWAYSGKSRFSEELQYT